MTDGNFFARQFLGNALGDYCWFAGVLVAGVLLRKPLAYLISLVLFRAFRKFSAGVGIEKLTALLTRPAGLFILISSAWLALGFLSFPADWHLTSPELQGLRRVVQKIFPVLLVFSFTWIILRITDFAGLVIRERAVQSHSRTAEQVVLFLKESIKIIIGISALLFVLGVVCGLDVTSLIAGLGIGGLALALAAKETIENLMGSFTIFLDKPFVVGDQVQAGPVKGTVERIGFRSTRIRTDEQSLVTVPNKKMVDAELDNITRRSSRKAVATLRLSSGTPAFQIQGVTDSIRKKLDGHPAVLKGSIVSFSDFGYGTFDLYVEYFVNTNESSVYYRIKEEVNFAVLSVIREYQVLFALPPFPEKQ
jgi:MscS family membrane protein